MLFTPSYDFYVEVAYVAAHDKKVYFGEQARLRIDTRQKLLDILQEEVKK